MSKYRHVEISKFSLVRCKDRGKLGERKAFGSFFLLEVIIIDTTLF